jgi:hypothetical protein
MEIVGLASVRRWITAMSRAYNRAVREADSAMWFYCGPLLRDVGRVVFILGALVLALWGGLTILETSPLMPSYTMRLEYELSLNKLELARLKSAQPATTRSVQR